MQRLENENTNTREYYNKALSTHFIETGLDISDAWRIDELLKYFNGGNLLDIGCGISPLCLMAKSKYTQSEVYGLDFANESIVLLRSRFPSIKYVVGDFYSLPFENESFDYAVLGEIIEHTEYPEKLIEESFRVLRKDGMLAISTPHNETQENHSYTQHIWSFQVKDIEKMIGKERIVELKTIGNNILCHAKKDYAHEDTQ